MKEMFEKHGEVFTVPLLHKKMTFLLGPTASPHFFNGTDNQMSQTEVRPRSAARPPSSPPSSLLPVARSTRPPAAVL
jgi:hypothetical protein